MAKVTSLGPIYLGMAKWSSLTELDLTNLQETQVEI